MSSKKVGYAFWRDVLSSPVYVAAPMVDMSELPFRILCRRYGAQLCYTPMLHGTQFLQDSSYRCDSFSTIPSDRPLIAQFCANDPNTFVDAAQIVARHCDAIDLNLGCPQAIAKKGHYGAFLEEEWDLIHSMVSKAANELPVPVTCKMRILPSPVLRSVEYARMLETSGCSALAVHGRTKFQKGHNTGLASWDVIKEIKQSVKIPVIANGNILCFSDVQNCLKHTGADAVMSADALLHNPALFTNENPPVWEIGEQYLKLAEEYEIPFRFARNHMYKILYLCMHRDKELMDLLQDSYTYEHFYNICNILKTWPTTAVYSNLCANDSKDANEEQEIGGEGFGFDDLFQVDMCDRKNEDINYWKLSGEKTEMSENIENDQKPKKNNESSANDGSVFLPIWLCHSRARIYDNTDPRGCYSKYFTTENSLEKEGETIEDKISRRKRRKILHYERVLAARRENRKIKRQRKKQKIAELKENNIPSQFVKNVSTERKPSRKQMKLAIHQKLINAQGNSPRICIDLGFTKEMTEKELNRLSIQLRRLYGSNRSSSKPFHLYFCNFNKEDNFFRICQAKNEGFASYVIDMVNQGPCDIFKPEEMIYLSPESENPLIELDNSKVYVIGGILDGSVKKGLSLSKAHEYNAPAVRLPILEHFVRNGPKCGTTVLTINQVFDILLKFHETHDWIEALSTGVPARKGFSLRAAELPDSTAVCVSSSTDPNTNDASAAQSTVNLKQNE